MQLSLSEACNRAFDAGTAAAVLAQCGVNGDGPAIWVKDVQGDYSPEITQQAHAVHCIDAVARYMQTNKVLLEVHRD